MGDQDIHSGLRPQDQLRLDGPSYNRQVEDPDTEIIRTAVSTDAHKSPGQASGISSTVCPVPHHLEHSELPMSQARVDLLLPDGLFTSPKEDKAGRAVHTFLDEEENFKSYHLVCHVSPCPWLGFKSLLELFSHIVTAHGEKFSLDFLKMFDAGGFVLAIPEARVQGHEQEYGLGYVGLPAMRCLFDECKKEALFNVGDLRDHLTREHKKPFGLPAGTQANWMAWHPKLKVHQDMGFPQDLGAYTPASLSIKIVERAAFWNSGSRGLHPGPTLASIMKDAEKETGTHRNQQRRGRCHPT